MKMFDTIYSANVTAGQFALMAAIALISGLAFSWIMSFGVKASKRFFLVTSLLPFVVGTVITFVSGSIGAGVAIGGAFGLIRFRSAPGSADEIAAILIAMGAGIAFGMGYVAYGAMMLIGLAIIYLLLSKLDIFGHKQLKPEQMLKITIPETLEYNGAFDEAFGRYLSTVEAVGVKTTGMGSMFRLSYKIVMKDTRQEKAFIDELRTKNGNLEISILPYSEDAGQL